MWRNPIGQNRATQKVTGHVAAEDPVWGCFYMRLAD
jgi:hypothetical protein